jgi:GSH-dependent disulfide-bond oxidoreductase
MLEVYTWEPNANSGKPLLCLKEKRVEFTYHYIDLGKRQQHSPQYLRINPDGTVPTIIHDGVVLTESSPALEYIDEVFAGPPLRPRDPYALWLMRRWCRYMDLYLCPALAMIGSQRAVATFKDQDPVQLEQALAAIPLPERRRSWSQLMFDRTSPQELAESNRRVLAGIDLYETALRSAPYLAGPEFSLADINAMATLYALPIMRPEQVNFACTPHLMDWFRRCHARPGIHAAFALGHEWIAGRVRDVRKLLGLA